MSPEFWYGFTSGFIVAGIFGFLLSRMRESRAKIGQMNKALDKFPDAEQPKLTPLGIVGHSATSVFGCLFWLFIFILFVITVLIFFKLIK